MSFTIPTEFFKIEKAPLFSKEEEPIFEFSLNAAQMQTLNALYKRNLKIQQPAHKEITIGDLEEYLRTTFPNAYFYLNKETATHIVQSTRKSHLIWISGIIKGTSYENFYKFLDSFFTNRGCLEKSQKGPLLDGTHFYYAIGNLRFELFLDTPPTAKISTSYGFEVGFDGSFIRCYDASKPCFLEQMDAASLQVYNNEFPIQLDSVLNIPFSHLQILDLFTLGGQIIFSEHPVSIIRNLYNENIQNIKKHVNIRFGSDQTGKTFFFLNRMIMLIDFLNAPVTFTGCSPSQTSAIIALIKMLFFEECLVENSNFQAIQLRPNAESSIAFIKYTKSANDYYLVVNRTPKYLLEEGQRSLLTIQPTALIHAINEIESALNVSQLIKYLHRYLEKLVLGDTSQIILAQIPYASYEAKKEEKLSTTQQEIECESQTDSSLTTVSESSPSTTQTTPTISESSTSVETTPSSLVLDISMIEAEGNSIIPILELNTESPSSDSEKEDPEIIDEKEIEENLAANKKTSQAPSGPKKKQRKKKNKNKKSKQQIKGELIPHTISNIKEVPQIKESIEKWNKGVAKIEDTLKHAFPDNKDLCLSILEVTNLIDLIENVEREKVFKRLLSDLGFHVMMTQFLKKNITEFESYIKVIQNLLKKNEQSEAKTKILLETLGEILKIWPWASRILIQFQRVMTHMIVNMTFPENYFVKLMRSDLKELSLIKRFLSHPANDIRKTLENIDQSLVTKILTSFIKMSPYLSYNYQVGMNDLFDLYAKYYLNIVGSMRQTFKSKDYGIQIDADLRKLVKNFVQPQLKLLEELKIGATFLKNLASQKTK
jgi:hypothetical protein